jgi:hypothetical protein
VSKSLFGNLQRFEKNIPLKISIDFKFGVYLQYRVDQKENTSRVLESHLLFYRNVCLSLVIRIIISCVQMKSWAEQALEKLKRLEQCKI